MLRNTISSNDATSSLIIPSTKIELSREDEKTLNLIQESNGVDITDDRIVEWLRCRENPIYYILNYVFIPEIGGKRKYTSDIFHNKFRRVIRTIYKYHMSVFMASRQLGKSIISACLLSWATTFFSNNKMVILNFRKFAAQNNLKNIKFINSNLPLWMRIPSISRSDIKEYLELQNGSRVDTFYPSTTSSPDTLARSMTVPILYIDEAAFIPHMHEIYGSAQPTLSTAREQAARNGYPYFILMTSTPNGIEGDGQFFYEMYDKAVESDNMFTEEEETGLEIWAPNCQEVLNDATKNSFVRIRYHWSENPFKSLEWYEQQKKELNFDRRKINQELDLLFVGGTNCIFDDEILQRFQSTARVKYIDLKHQVKLDVYNEIDVQDYYLVGVDTASSIKGAFNALEVFSYRNFTQVAEANIRLGSLVKYAEVVDSLFRWLYSLVGTRIILCIENNSIGKAIIENLVYHVNDFVYNPFIYKEKNKEELGIYTSTKTKELMVSMLYDYIKESPESLKSQDFIAQLSAIQKTNRGTIRTSGFSDMFMAASFCAYVRHATTLEILPLLGFTNTQIQQNFFNVVKSAADMMNTRVMLKNEMGFSSSQSQGLFGDNVRTVKEDQMMSEQFDQQQQVISGDDWRIYMPMFSLFDK